MAKVTYTEYFLKHMHHAPDAHLRVAVIIPAHPTISLQEGGKLRWEPVVDCLLNKVLARLVCLHGVGAIPSGCSVSAFFYGGVAGRRPWKAIANGIAWLNNQYKGGTRHLVVIAHDVEDVYTRGLKPGQNEATSNTKLAREMIQNSIRFSIIAGQSQWAPVLVEFHQKAYAPEMTDIEDSAATTDIGDISLVNPARTSIWPLFTDDRGNVKQFAAHMQGFVRANFMDYSMPVKQWWDGLRVGKSDIPPQVPQKWQGYGAPEFDTETDTFSWLI